MNTFYNETMIADFIILFEREINQWNVSVGLENKFKKLLGRVQKFEEEITNSEKYFK